MTGFSTRILALLGGFVAAVATLWVRALPTWGTVVDDAYISARYGEHLAAGYGLVYNAGEPPIEGYTNLVWTAGLAVVRGLGLPMHESMEVLGLVWATVALAGLVALADAVLDHPRVPWLAALPALFLAATPHFAVIATNGLETSQFIAAVVWAIWASWVAKGRWRWAAAVLLGSLAWVRPEGILVAGGVVLIDLIARRKALSSAHTWAYLAGTVGLFLPLEAWRYGTYGAWLPNTGAAKSNLSWWGALKLNVKYVGGDPEVWIGTLVALIVGAVSSRWSWRKALLLCLVGGLTLIASRVYLWMPGGRLLVLPLALSWVVAALPLRPLLSKHGSRRAPRAVWAVVLAGCLVYMVVGQTTDFQRGRDERHSVVKPNPARLAGEHLAAHLPAGSWLATRDAGLLAWSVGTDIKVAELHPRALTQPHPDGDDADWQALLDGPPAAVALTVNASTKKPFYYSLERRIWRKVGGEYHYLGRVEQHYRRHYDLYVRADLDVPPLDPEVVTNFVGTLPRTTVRRAGDAP